MNNRQAGGRRRGRNNNNRNQGNRGGGGVDRENRIDNRARGNAAQMLDKYKKMAQDAQVNGDRVNAEYYHQFADHYFRVNADTQARREEQRLAREEQRSQNAERNDGASDAGEQEDGERQDRGPRGRGRRPKMDDQREKAAATEDGDSAEATAEKKPVRARRPRKPAAEIAEANGESNGLDASALPPSIAVSANDGDDAEVEVEKKPARKRRTVKAKAAEAETTQEGDAA